MLSWPHFAVRWKTAQTKKTNDFLCCTTYWPFMQSLATAIAPVVAAIAKQSDLFMEYLLSRYCQAYCPKLCQAMVRQIAVQLRVGWGGSAASGGRAPVVARGGGARRSSRSRSRSDPEVVHWTSSLASTRSSEHKEASFLVE